MSNDQEFVVNFVKDSAYRRFNVTGVLTNIHKNSFNIELFEETLPLMKTFKIDTDGVSSAELEAANFINIVHASITISPEYLPQIINSLQAVYDNFKGGKGNGD